MSDVFRKYVIMDPNQYYQDLIQQGYSSVDAANFTHQYYPDFQGTGQGMSMMTPPPPGSMEMGGLAAGGFGAPAGGMAAGGMAAGGAAAAGGGMSMATIAVVSVLVLGGVGTGGYFLYDYLTEPDFYGEVYWAEEGYGYIFEEDEIRIAVPQIDGDCEGWEDADSFDGQPMTNEKGVCTWSLEEGDYESTEKDGYYQICMDEDCMDVYTYDNGIIMENENHECTILVSEISKPDPSLVTSLAGDDDENTWVNEWYEIAEEISKDDPPASCDSFSQFSNDDDSNEGSLDMYQFDDRDAMNDPAMNASGGDALVHIMMMQGSDLNWALVEVTISVDGGASFQCTDEGWADEYSSCVYTTDEDKNWDVAEEITIYEGSDTNLCDGTSGGCEVQVTISKKAVGNSEGRVLAQLNAWAEA